MQLSDEMLLSLCDQTNFSDTLVLYQAIQDYINKSIKSSYISRALDRTTLNDRYPTFGREGDFFTRNPVGFNYSKKKVTIPTFDIAAVPVVPPEWFRYRQVDKLRKVIDESITAICETQIEWLYQLVQTCGQFNKFYPLVSTEDQLTEKFLSMILAPMEKIGVLPAALFMNVKDVIDGTYGTAHILSKFNMSLYAIRGDDRAYYIFGKSQNPDFSTGHIVDNLTKLRINPIDDPNVWKSPVPIKISQNSGFLVGAPAVLKVNRVWEDGKPKSNSEVCNRYSQIRAFVVDQKAPEDIVSIVS